MKGYEIFKGIANKEIKDGTQFRMLEDNNIYTYRNNNFVCKYGGMNVIAILNQEFEIIEEQQDINIQEIEQLNAYKLMESPYMANLLKEQRYDEFMKHLKQSEVEIADKLIKLIWAVEEIRKDLN